jgi:hypothetical protein
MQYRGGPHVFFSFGLGSKCGGGTGIFFIVPNVFPSSSQCVPQNVPNSIALLSHMLIQYSLPKVELSWAPILSLEMEVV